MLELLATVDPMAALLGSLWLFAAGMFPLGFMLGSTCSACCGEEPCSACTQGSLPETITVSLSGFSDEQEPGPDLIALSVASCYGFGAEARVAEPGGNADTDKGPISAVEVTKGGSGYAKIGRVAPTVTVTGTSGSGTGATFAVTLASSKDACNVDRWAVSKVVRTGGTGYTSGDTLTFSVAGGDTQEAAATAEIAGTTYAEPTLSLSVAGGTGAVLEISYLKITASWGDGFSDAWLIDQITVANGGTGYTDNAVVTVTLGQDDEARPFSGTELRARTGVRAPADNWTLQSGSPAPTGTGLVISMTFGAPYYDADVDRVVVSATAVSVVNGGTGYAVGQRVRPRAVEGSPGSTLLRATVRISQVGAGGTVLGVELAPVSFAGGRYAIDNGIIESVAINFQAGWRKVINNPDGVLVTNGGIYYREDASVPAYVSPVTISVTQSPPSAGTGASLSAVIDDDPASETFGHITGVTVDDGGDDYLAWQYRPVACCEDYWNGRSFVLRRISGSCYYQHVVCGTECGQVVGVEYRGPSLPPVVGVGGRILWYDNGSPVAAQSTCDQSMEGTSLVTNCSDFSFTATNEAGVTATVTAGGNYDPQDQSDNGTGRCHTCCRGEDDPPEEIEVEVADGYNTQSGQVAWLAPQYYGTFAPLVPADASLPLPIVVLRREWQFITPPQDGSQGCYASWSGQVPVLVGGLSVPNNDSLFDWYDLSVSVGTCSNSSISDCDHCWKKCETTAFVQTIYNCYGTSAPDRGGSEECLNCTNSPMCRPAAGEYFITTNIFDDSLCNIPGGVRVRVL